MKVLHLCTYDTGGAANAALRLHEGLLNLGEKSVFASKLTTSPGRNRMAVLKPRGDWIARHSCSLEFHLARVLHPRVRPVLTREMLPSCGVRAISAVKPDVINLHWVEHGMITSRDLRNLAAKRIPMVWTLHDMAPLTGGFGYREAMGLDPSPNGPLVCKGLQTSASRDILDRRTRALEKANLTVVAPSAWLAEEARRSPVFSNHRVEHVPYGIDINVFHPLSKESAREHWNIPQDAVVLLFGADTFEDGRKGIHHLREALRHLPPAPDGKSLLLLGFGNKTPLKPDDFPILAKGVGRLSNPAELAQLYSASDVFICPSREDNLPNTIVESLACGTPVVGFRVGGLMDLVKDGVTGALASCYDEKALAEALRRVISPDVNLRAEMRRNCRELAANTRTLEIQARRYIELYQDLMPRTSN